MITLKKNFFLYLEEIDNKLELNYNKNIKELKKIIKDSLKN